jgi:activator of 2-hydroxyglutaryl-CoA dehydratase
MMSLPEDEAVELERLYERRKKMEDCLDCTKQQMISGQPFITAIGAAVINQLHKMIVEISDEIDELWARGELDSFGRPIQGTFGFYWECSINEDEIPF